MSSSPPRRRPPTTPGVICLNPDRLHSGSSADGKQPVCVFVLQLINQKIRMCTQLKSCRSFLSVLEHLLAVGNYLNENAGKGKAKGIRLSSLTKVRLRPLNERPLPPGSPSAAPRPSAAAFRPSRSASGVDARVAVVTGDATGAGESGGTGRASWRLPTRAAPTVSSSSPSSAAEAGSRRRLLAC